MEQIDAKWLRIWSIIHCGAGFQEKANELMNVLKSIDKKEQV